MHIPHHRLHTQQIAQQQFQQPNELLNWMGAMQAQDYEMSKWAVALRLPDANENKIETTLNNGELIRTHILRPTWHIVSAENLRWMMDLSAPQLIKTLNSYCKQVGLDAKTLVKAEKIILKLLAKKNHCTRDEIMIVLQKEKINTTDLRSAHIMFHAELNGLVCNGIRKGKEISYALLDERVLQSKKMNREEALAKLAAIYFQSHSPATVKDFSWWSGLNQTDAKKAIDFISKNLEKFEVGEQTYFVSMTEKNIPLAPFKGGIKASEIHLLPAFDEYIISYAHRFDVVDEKYASEVFTNNGIFKPMIIRDGKIIGTWKRTIAGKKLKTEIFPFEKISKQTEKEIEKKMEVFKKYLFEKIIFEKINLCQKTLKYQ
jgi:Winged helix DNA-binding domain